MALVACPECQKEVSTHALSCPECAFPFPGNQASTVGQSGSKLKTCSDCGCPVSRQAQSCPHCGLQLMEKKGDIAINGTGVEETWLCTHCGTPYSKKVSNGKELGRSFDGIYRTPRRRSQLWEDPFRQTNSEEIIAPIRYPRSRKKSIFLGLLFLLVITASVFGAAAWHLQGLNPLEALVYWRM